VLESSTEKCPYCGGSGHVRSVSSLALQVLRALEDQLMKGATHNLIARTRPDVALYVLNQKRAHLRALEERFAITLTVSADETLTAPLAFAVDRGEQVHTVEAAKAIAEKSEATAIPLEEEDDLEETAEFETETEEGEAPVSDVAAEQGEGEGVGRHRRRRRRRGGRNGGEAHAQPNGHQDIGEEVDESGPEAIGEMAADDVAEEVGETVAIDRGEAHREGERRRRRRGRRGGRRNRMDREREGTPGLNEHDTQEPQHAVTTAEALTAPPSMEPDLTEAVADLDAAPASAPSPAEPADLEVAQASPPPAQPEPPRRRSTVREPAPIASGPEVSQPAPPQPTSPAPEPVITEVGDSQITDRPRRSGWWSRRIAGS